MRLYLVRHGQAVDAMVDPARPLSGEGRREAERLASYVAGLAPGWATVWHSGKRRAREAAEILVSGAGAAVPVTERGGLLPNDPVEPVADELRVLDEEICVVGHLPFLARLASYLTTGNADLAIWDLDTCAMLCLEGSRGGPWWVCWLVTPRILP